MKINIVGRLYNIFRNNFFSFSSKNKDTEREANPAEIITKEIDGLWEMIRQENKGLLSETECRERIARSFNNVNERFSNEQLDNVYTWPRYVKIAVNVVNEPVNELIAYVKESNYKRLTKRLSDLSHSLYNEEEENVKSNMEKFSLAVYLHILEDINPKDIPSCLALGRIFQKRAEYDAAREWFKKVTETDEPFNGVTALLACYEDETKEILSNRKNRHSYDPNFSEKIKYLNDCQCDIYEKWCRAAEERIKDSAEVTEQQKREYVSLMTGYARFERNRGNYRKAFCLLDRVPKTYPDAFRVYVEKAMLYQFKPYKNNYYSLDKAIDFFKKAEAAIEESGTANAKSKKSILMPLANTYFQLGRYQEAESVCDSVLLIDGNEQRAITLKQRITCLVA